MPSGALFLFYGGKMDEMLMQLYALEEIDRKCYEVKRQMGDLPAKREKINALIGKVNTESETKREAKARMDEENKRMEEQNSVYREKIKSDKQYLNSVKSNEEYMMILDGIKKKQDTISENETVILRNMTEMERFDEDLKKIEEEKAKEDSIEKQLQEVNEQLRSFEGELKDLNEKREYILSHLPEDIRKRYQKIYDKRKGLAIVLIDDAHCTGCYSQIPQQLYDKVRSMKREEICLNCGRMLLLKKDEGSSKI